MDYLLRKIGLFTLFIIPKLLFATDLLFPPGERYEYSVKLAGTTVGFVSLETVEDQEKANNGQVHFKAYLESRGIVKLFYHYNEEIHLIYDLKNKQPLAVDVKREERKLRAHTEIYFDWKNKRVKEIENSTHPGEEPHHRIKNWDIAEQNAQSLYSVLFYGRGLDLPTETQLSFPITHDEKNYFFKAKIEKGESVRAIKQNWESVRLVVDKEFTARFSKTIREEPMIWLSNNLKHSLLRLEIKTKFGLIALNLEHTTAN